MNIILSFSGTCSSQSIKVPGCTAKQNNKHVFNMSVSEFNNLAVAGNQEGSLS